MRFFRLFFFTTIFLPFFGCKNAGNNEIRVITANEMLTNFKYNKVQVVDVRPVNEYKESHLFNAQNIIYDKDFRKKLSNLDKEKPVAIYCTTGNISPEAARILKEAGFQNIYILKGGIKKWKDENNLPVE